MAWAGQSAHPGISDRQKRQLHHIATMTKSSSDLEKQPDHSTDQTTDVEPSVEAAAELSPAPDGGRVAWLVAVGACCTSFAGLGFANSTGIFIEYYLSHQLQDKTPDDVAWIGSLSNFIQFASGCIGGPLFDRYGAWVIRPAAILYLLAIMMTSLCHEYWQFMLAQGVLLGIGMGGLMFPALAALLNDSSLGFGWSVRVVGFVMMPFLLFSCVFIKARLPPKVSSFFDGSAFKQTEFCLLAGAMFFMMLGVFTPLFYIPTLAVSRGMNATLASYLLAIINGASIFGRIIPGVLADKLGPSNVFSVAGIVTGVIVCCLDEPSGTAQFVVYCVFIGFCSGTVISGGSAALARTVKNPQLMGTYLGMGMGLSSIAVLIGPPINGRLLDQYGFLSVGLFSGLVCLVGGALALLSKVFSPHGLISKF
uniref:Major facilitator superfamily (MFS) profile domain-containing protein n=1 Tax=Bionectria ochroleuca TaxID=29856 RepID=A0A0B7KBY3_BIOOC